MSWLTFHTFTQLGCVVACWHNVWFYIKDYDAINHSGLRLDEINRRSISGIVGWAGMGLATTLFAWCLVVDLAEPIGGSGFVLARAGIIASAVCLGWRSKCFWLWLMGATSALTIASTFA